MLRPLRYTLKNGDVVKNSTRAAIKASKDWLLLAKPRRRAIRIKHVIDAAERIKGWRSARNRWNARRTPVSASTWAASQGQFETVSTEYLAVSARQKISICGFRLWQYSARQVAEDFYNSTRGTPPTETAEGSRTLAEACALGDGDLAIHVPASTE